MSFTPCKDCTKRELGCHDRCPEYTQFKLELEEINEKRRNDTRFSNNPRIEKLVRAKRRHNSCR